MTLTGGFEFILQIPELEVIVVVHIVDARPPALPSLLQWNASTSSSFTPGAQKSPMFKEHIKIWSVPMQTSMHSFREAFCSDARLTSSKAGACIVTARSEAQLR